MKMPSGANCLPDGIFFAFGDFDFPHAVRFWKQGFRLCGGDPLPQCCCLLKAQ